jgi:hypothetical protein
MLLEFTSRHLVNSHLFWDFDNRQSCDFAGNPARETVPAGPHVEEDAVPEGLHDTADGLPSGVQVFGMDDLFGIHNAIADAVGEPHVKLTTRTPLPPAKWRRL